MTILICGASGLVGRDLCDLLDRENIRYYGTYNKCTDKAFCERENMFRVDFTNPGEVTDLFAEHKSKWLVVIFLVVQRMVDVCENDWNAIMRVNVDAVDITSALCAKHGIYFIHLSTDYVFDGSASPYFPTCSQVNPLQNYGITKLISEYRVQRNYMPPTSSFLGGSDSLLSTPPNYCIIRTPVLYSANPATPIYDNAVTVLAKNIMDLRTQVSGAREDDFYIRRPVYIPDLCIFIRVVATIAIESGSSSDSDRNGAKFSGVYHFYNPDNKFTKYQMTTKIADYLQLSHHHIVPVCPSSAGAGAADSGDNKCRVYAARRPYDTELRDIRYNIRNFFTHTFEETIPAAFSRFKHPKLGVTGTGTGTGARSRYFLMFDLDGTLVNTSYTHYRSYLEVFRNRGLTFMTFQEWNEYINYKNIHTYVETVASELAHHDIYETERILSDIRNEKLAAFRNYAFTYITPTKNALDMLRFIEANQDTVTAVVVTNSSSATTDIIREVVPELNKITKWCVRETYTEPKPHPESYTKAKEMFYKNEDYVIGFENTSIGYESLRHVTSIVYVYVDENDEYAKRDKWYYKKDAFIFDDFRSV
jgi:dTDP-4-dehydrorhamnose reductase/beta-phosphoglucomutase-like phosphatase (HAD superfamily)